LAFVLLVVAFGLLFVIGGLLRSEQHHAAPTTQSPEVLDLKGLRPGDSLT
jgi:hypothetical protein